MIITKAIEQLLSSGSLLVFRRIFLTTLSQDASKRERLRKYSTHGQTTHGREVAFTTAQIPVKHTDYTQQHNICNTS